MSSSTQEQDQKQSLTADSEQGVTKSEKDKDNSGGLFSEKTNRDSKNKDKSERAIGKKGNLFGRLRQRFGEMMGTNNRTEYDEDFRNKLRLAQTTKEYLDDLLNSIHQILAFKEEKYDKVARCLELIGQLHVQIDHPKNATTWKESSELHRILGEDEQQMRSEMCKSLQPLHDYVNYEYPHLKEEKERLTRRRLEMDDIRNRMTKTTRLTATYEVATRNFNFQLDKVQQIVNEMPAKLELYRTILLEVMELEKNHHEKIAKRIHGTLMKITGEN